MKDITGMRFGKLTVISKSHKDNFDKWHWLCRCDCGNVTTVEGNRLRSGKTKSCGCLQRQHRKTGFHKKHGMTDSRLYVIWSNMKARCENPNSTSWKNYGGRGISVCSEWKAFIPFRDWAVSSGYSHELSIERIDVNGNYCPENCKWITKGEQYLNRTDSHKITAFGISRTIKEWADETGVPYDTIERRINAYHWSPEDAVTTPPWGKRHK